MDVAEQLRSLRRGAAEIISEEELLSKLREGRPLRVKLGVDPTAASVTLGWAVVLRKLRQFQDLGHVGVLVIGDFTAMIGDPSGRTKTRPPLTREQVDANVRAVSGEFFKILDPDRTEIRYNRDWLGAMDFEQVIRLAAQVTVARILERDDFEKRLREERPIALHEVLYPLCQAQDSVAIQADVELGGSDQKFNILLGRTLQAHVGQAPQVALLMPLLVGTDGHDKMSQSLGNYVGIGEPPNEIFGKTMSIPDGLLLNWVELCTDLDPEGFRRRLEGGENPRDLKLELAHELVRLYHGAAAADAARDFFVRTFSRRENPVDAPEAVIPPEVVVDGCVRWPALLVALGLAPSNSEAKRRMAEGAVKLDGDRQTDPATPVPLSALDGKVLQYGKHEFRRLISGR